MPARNRNKKKNVKKSKNMLTKNIYSLRPDYHAKLHVSSVPEITNNSSFDEFGSLQFKLTDIIDYTTYTSLWDQYRINKVLVRFEPVGPTVLNKPYDDATTSNALQQVPLFCTCLDFDDAATPTSYDDVKKRQGSKETPSTKLHKYYFTPSKLLTVYAAPTSGYMADFSNKWLDSNTTTAIPHYGIKWALKVGSPTGCWRYRVNITYYISFRSRVG